MIRKIGPCEGIDNRDFDLAVVPVGFESRATFALARLGDVSAIIAPEFQERQQIGYEANRAAVVARGGTLIPYKEAQFYGDFKRALLQLLSEKEVKTIFMDISSMSRPMMADSFRCMSSIDGVEFEIVVCYSVAEYVEPDKFDLPVTVSGPIIPELAGWTLNPEWPSAAIVGLGYESDHALGALEYLEPSAAWVFFPCSPDHRYEDKVWEANARLLANIPERLIYKYNVEDPLAAFTALSGLVQGLIDGYRPIIIPFGPKVFTAVTILAALHHHPQTAVWRVSGEQRSRPIDRKPSGQLVFFELSLSGG